MILFTDFSKDVTGCGCISSTIRECETDFRGGGTGIPGLLH